MREALDQLLHLALGAALAALFVWVSPTLSVVAAAILREDAQHRPEEGWGWPFNGWRRWVDVAFFGLGAGAVEAAWRLT